MPNAPLTSTVCATGRSICRRVKNASARRCVAPPIGHGRALATVAQHVRHDRRAGLSRRCSRARPGVQGDHQLTVEKPHFDIACGEPEAPLLCLGRHRVVMMSNDSNAALTAGTFSPARWDPSPAAWQASLVGEFGRLHAQTARIWRGGCRRIIYRALVADAGEPRRKCPPGRAPIRRVHLICAMILFGA